MREYITKELASKLNEAEEATTSILKIGEWISKHYFDIPQYVRIGIIVLAIAIALILIILYLIAQHYNKPF